MCEYCGDSFETPSGLIRHAKAKHPSEVKALDENDTNTIQKNGKLKNAIRDGKFTVRLLSIRLLQTVKIIATNTHH